MKEITEDNYKQLEYNWGGIIIAYPRVALYFNADFYFIKQKINYDTDERTYFYSGVNKEDEVSELSPDWHKKDFESCFGNWNEIKYYQFENIDEFCNWYVHKDDKLKESINKFKESVKDSPFKSVELPEDVKEQLEDQANPVLTYYKHGDGSENRLYSLDEIRDKMNPGWNTRRAKLHDVLKLLELRDMRQNTIDSLMQTTVPSMQEHLVKQLERDEQRIEDFLNEKVL